MRANFPAPLKHFREYRFPLSLFAIIFSCLIAKAENEAFTIEPAPDWVTIWDSSFHSNTAEFGGAREGLSYLLIDKQLHAEEKQRYWRIVTRIENFQGVQDQGRQSIDFDPAYQTLTIHQINIIRDGLILNRLDEDKIKVIQRETDLQKHLYDESLTALTILEDLRVGDILDVAYTVTGHNPALEGAFVANYSFGFSVPVSNIRYRLLIESDRQIHIRNYGSTPTPEKTEKNGLIRYLWEAETVAPIYWEDTTPSSYDPYPKVRISEYRDWASVAKWALPLYEKALQSHESILAHPEIPKICNDQSAPLSQRIRAAVEFVQDEVRYFGIEIGPNSLIPHEASEVIARRFGDCKDKSVLLVAILREMGIEAHPVLIATEHKKNLPEHLASPYAFNHATVQIILDNREKLYVDPTYTYQRGDIDKRFYPDYKYGLPVKEGQTDLEKIDLRTSEYSRTHVKERFVITSTEEPISLYIDTQYDGRSADRQRNYVNSNSLEQIERNYSEFYTKYYDGLSLEEPISIIDEENSNSLSIKESYTIENPWDFSNDGTQRSISTRAIFIDEALSFPDRRENRTAPLYLVYPFSFTKSVTFELPRKWELEDSNDDIENAYFHFSRSIQNLGNQVIVNYSFDSKRDEVPVDQVATYLEDAYTVDDLLQFELKDDISNPIDVSKTSVTTDSAVIARQTRPFLLMSIASSAIAAWFFTPNWIRKKSLYFVPRNFKKWKIIVATTITISLLTIALVVAVTEFANWYSSETEGRDQIQTGETFILLFGLLGRVAAITILGQLLLHKAKDALYSECVRVASLTYLIVFGVQLFARYGTTIGSFGVELSHFVEISIAASMAAASFLLRAPSEEKSIPEASAQEG